MPKCLSFSLKNTGKTIFKQISKSRGPDGMILLTEYHANSIRLRRVILLRSDIRLTTSDIRFASFMANRISL